MATVIDNILGMATDFNCGVILSHHERKSGAGEDGELMSAGRGSTVLEGAVAVMENFQSAKGGDFRELTWSKARYLQPPPPVRLEYSFETGWYRHVPEDELEQAILHGAGGEQRGADDRRPCWPRRSGEKPEKIEQVADQDDRRGPHHPHGEHVRPGRIHRLPLSDQDAGQHGRRCRVLMTFISAQALYEAHADVVEEFLGEPVRMWHELTFAEQSEWQRHADEVNAKDKEDDA